MVIAELFRFQCVLVVVSVYEFPAFDDEGRAYGLCEFTANLESFAKRLESKLKGAI